MEIIDDKGNARKFYTADESKRVLAGVMALIFGSLGIHKFVLGYTLQGIIMLCITLFSIFLLSPLIYLIGFIEGIVYLTKSDQEFVDTYQNNRKNWF